MRFLVLLLGLAAVVGCWNRETPVSSFYCDDHDFLSAAGRGDLAYVKRCVRGGKSVNTRRWATTALHSAASEGHLEVVKYLVEQGADINATTSRYGWTVLHYAATWGQLAVVRYLVEQGADVNAKDSDGDTARGLAEMFGHTAVARYLRSVGG